MPKTNAGGPQPGAGAPKGHIPQRKAAQALSRAQVAPQGSDLTQLAPAIEGIIKWCARGKTDSWIARELGHDRHFVGRCRKRYRQHISAAIDQMVDPKAVFRQFIPSVLEGYEDLITDTDPLAKATRGAMLRDAADRIWDKARIISESYASHEVNINIISSDAGLGARFAEPAAVYDLPASNASSEPFVASPDSSSEPDEPV